MARSRRRLLAGRSSQKRGFGSSLRAIPSWASFERLEQRQVLATDVNVSVGLGITQVDSSIHGGDQRIVKQGVGTLVLSAANSHTGGVVVAEGTLVVRDAAALGHGVIVVQSGAKLVLDNGQDPVIAESLVLQQGGMIDVGAGRLEILAGFTQEQLISAIRTAKGDGSWDGQAGIGSSVVRSLYVDETFRTLGWLTWISNGGSSFTVGFAAAGDTNLDGIVDTLDLANITAGVGLDTGLAATWDVGDFNHDLLVDINDIADLIVAGLYGEDTYFLPDPPSTPTALVAANDSPTSVRLSWSNGDVPYGFEIEQSSDGVTGWRAASVVSGSLSTSPTASGSDTRAVVGGLQTGVTTYFRIRSYNVKPSWWWDDRYRSADSAAVAATPRAGTKLYWDPDGVTTNNVIETGAGLGGAGVWADGGGSAWFNPSLNGGAGGYESWNNNQGDTAMFAGYATNAVTIAGEVSAARLEFHNAEHTLSGGTLRTGAAGTTFRTAVGARIDTPITGTTGITKMGTAALTLGAPVNGYTGDTQVAVGTLDVRGTIQSRVLLTGGTVLGVMFNDPDLAAAVREAIGVDTNTWMTTGVLQNSPVLTSLTVNGNAISDLTGIASLSALTSLTLVPRDHAAVPLGITSLAPLAGLSNLTTLSLQDLGLTTAQLATLPVLPALTQLDVRDNAIVTIPASVANWTKLSTLLVHGNQAITTDPRSGLAAIKGKAIHVDIAPDRPELATTITDLAARLYYLPLKMLEYVTNTIVYQPYVGAMKGPLATLQTKAGNDWDTNSLLAALYGAAGITMNYVSGVVELTETQLNEYIGTRDKGAATAALQAAGAAPFDVGPNVALNHTWLEATLVDPATRVERQVAIDASWKRRDYAPGLPGVLASLPFTSLEPDYFTNPVWQSKSTAEYYEAKVATWLTQHHPGLTIADVGYDGPIRQQSVTALPTELPYDVITKEAPQSAIPVTARYKVAIKLSKDQTQYFGGAGAELWLDEASLKRLTLDPHLDGSGTAQPVLRSDGVAIATATTAITNAAATQLSLVITVTAPLGGTSYSRTFTRAADRYVAIGLDANQYSESLLVDKRAIANAQQLNKANGFAVDNDSAVGGFLDLAISQYFTEADADEASLAALTSAIPDRTIVALGIATSDSALSSLATAGLQLPYLPDDMGIDVPGNVTGGFPIDTSTTAIVLSRNLLMGYANSSLEGLVLERLTNFQSVSTTRAFQLAASSAEGLAGLVEINATNAANIALLLPAVRAEIRQAIKSIVTNGLVGVADYAGMTFAALVPKSEIAVGDSGNVNTQWKGVGYTLTIASAPPAKAGLIGKTVGYIIHGAVGQDALSSHGGWTSKASLPATLIPSNIGASSYSAGDPVNVANGNVYHEETDVEIPNLGAALSFHRRFDSINTVSGLAGAAAASSDRGMGEGWSFAYSDRLEVGVDGANTVTWFTDGGLRLVFTYSAGGYKNPAGAFGVLSGSPTAGFTWKDFDGNTTSFGPKVGDYCPLVSRSDRFGNGIRVTYVPGTDRIANVADLRDATRCLSLTYNTDSRPHISQITDFTGRSWAYTYGQDGRLATSTAPVPASGKIAPHVTYTYHPDPARRGLLASVTDPSGFVTSWDYYANRRGFRVTDTEGLQHSFSYDLFHDQSTFINEKGYGTRYSYDKQGNLLEVRQPDRTRERSTWSDKGLELSSTDAYGQTETYAYDTHLGKVITRIDRAQQAWTTTYRGAPSDTFDRVNSNTLGNRWIIGAGGFSLVANKATAAAAEVSFATATNFTATNVHVEADIDLIDMTATRSAGLVARVSATGTTYYLAELQRAGGQVTTSAIIWRIANGTATQLATLNGLVNGFTKASGRMSFDVSGNSLMLAIDGVTLLTTSDTAIPTGGGAGIRFFGIGATADNVSIEDRSVPHDIDTQTQVAAVDNSAGDVVTRFTYDASGFLTSRTDDYGIEKKNATTQFTQAPGGRGLIQSSTSPRQVVTSFEYNAAGQVTARTTAMGMGQFVTLHSDYDARGNLLSRTDGNENVTAFTYDALGRRITETTPDPDTTGPLLPIVTTFTYDASGNVLSTRLNDGRVTGATYDKRQREVKRVLPDGTYTLATYDAVGNLATETDALGHITRHVYDSRSRLVATVYPDGTTTRTRYDGGGRVVAVIDQAGAVTSYGYDTLGRKILETQPDPDGTGPLPAPCTAWGYDSRGNLEFVTPAFVGQAGIVAGHAARSTHFTYDALGRKTTETQADPDGLGALPRPVISYTYFADGNLKTVTDARGFVTTYGYDQLGRKTIETSPDPDGTDSLPSLIRKFVYDDAGNLRFEIGPGGIDETSVDFTTEHVYDALNRETRTILPDPDGSAGQLARPWTARAFDQRGFLVSKTDLGERTTTYSNDLFGRPRLITDAAGGTQGNVYDAAGNVVYATDSLGRRTFFTYDTMNRPVAVRAPRPDASAATPITTSTYDVTGNLVQSTDALNRTTWRQYDLLGRLTAETDPLGVFSGDSQHTTHTEYDSAGRVTATVDGLGRRTDTVYDNLGRRIRVLEPNVGQERPTTYYGYDAAGNLRFTTDPRGMAPGATGYTTWMFYDALGRQTATVDALGADWSLTPNTATSLPDSLPGTVTSNVTRTFYDARGRVTSTVDAAGRTTDYSYDNLGRKLSEIAPAPDATKPRPATIYVYNASSNITSTIRTSLNATLSVGESYAYDALNRRTAVTDGRGLSTVTSFDAVGNITSVTDASGNVTDYEYDRLNRLVTETDPLKSTNSKTSYAYDLVGNKTKETDRLGRVTTFVYDTANRLVEERWQASASAAVSHTITRFYDGSDQLLGVTENDTINPAAATAWQYTYDTAGNVVKSRVAPGELVQSPALLGVPIPPGSLAAGDLTIDWDADGQLERYDSYQITVAIGDQILITASSAGFDPVLILQRPTGGVATAFFDDSSGGGTSARMLVTADVAGTWVIAVTSRAPNTVGAYDLQIVSDKNAIVPTALVEYDFAYDQVGNVTAAAEDSTAIANCPGVGKAADGLGIATFYTVNALNRVTAYRHLDTNNTDVVTKRVLYTYRGDGTVGSVARYAAAGVSAPVGTSTATYDGVGRLTGITHAPAATGSLSVSYGYTYDAAGRIQTMTTPEGTSTFTLDAADQLSSASLTGETYTYDNTGNRTNGGTQTGQGNRLVFDGTYRYAYDAEGNRTAKYKDTNVGGVLSAGDTDVTVYRYDQRNRLVGVSHVANWTATQDLGLATFTASSTALPGSDLELRYTYDYADRRIRRSMDTDGAAGASAESVSFAAYAGDARTLEIARTASFPGGFLGQVIQRNFYGNGQDEILAVDKITWNGTTPTTSTFWTFTDHQDTVRDIVSGNAADRGQVVEHRQYDSFGKIVTRTIGAAPIPGIDFGYAGRPLESRTGLSDNRARWYEPGTGRFINEDPSGFKGGDANLFRYVGNDPLDQVDPSGLTGIWAKYGSALSDDGTALWKQQSSVAALANRSVSPSRPAATRVPALSSTAPIPTVSTSRGIVSAVPSTTPMGTPLATPLSHWTDNIYQSYGNSTTFLRSLAINTEIDRMSDGAAIGLLYQNYIGRSGVHDMYATHGLPTAVTPIGSGSSARYTFADGTRYTPLYEPTTQQYAVAAFSMIPAARAALVNAPLFTTAGHALSGAIEEAVPYPVSVPRSAVRAADAVYGGVRQASQILQDINVPRDVRKRVLEAFDVRTIRVRAAGDAEFGIRYFDNVDAFPRGGFLFETFPASRDSLGLEIKWNQMTGFKQWQLRPEAAVFEGVSSRQGVWRGGQTQKYILDPTRDLLEP